MPAYPSLPRNARVVVDATGISVVADDAGGNADPRAAFKQRLADAWRGPDRALTNTLDHLKRKVEISQAWCGGDAGDSEPDAAYAAFKSTLASAWQNVAAGGPTPRAPKPADPPWQTMAGGRRKYRPGLARSDAVSDDADDSQPAVMFDDDDAAQTRRDEAQRAYCARVRDAWKG